MQRNPLRKRSRSPSPQPSSRPRSRSPMRKRKQQSRSQSGMRGGDGDQGFILIRTNDQYEVFQIFPMKKYQQESLRDYIRKKYTGQKEYNPSTGIIFKIEYDPKEDMHYLIREDKSVSAISFDKDKLITIARRLNRFST